MTDEPNDPLSQLVELQKRVQKALQPSAALMAEWQKALQPSAALMAEWQKALQPSAALMEEWQKTLQPSAALMEQWQKTLQPSAALMEEWQKTLQSSAALVEQWQKILQTSLTTLARAGWGELNLGEGLLGDFWLATDAYIYGYPLVTMEMTRRVFTNVAKPEGTHAPMGQLIKMREYPTPAFHDFTAPNADTLYTTAFLNVGEEPWVLSLPDMKGRYALFPMLDGWTNVFQVPGKRTTGTEAQTYAITGPGWTGKLPEGVREYKSPTNLVWMFGRIYCTGTPEDYKAVHEIQDQVGLVPLSSYGKPYTPPEGNVDPSIDMKTPVRDQVNRMSTVEYFTLLAQLMKTNPPAPEDAPALARFASIGLVAGQDFDASKLNAVFAKRIPEVGFDRILAQYKINKEVKDINGWGFTTKTGLYGTDYRMRALITAIGLGANRPQDAVYPTSLKDANRSDYHGANNYVMRFAKGKLPPAEGFWSLTMYNSQLFFVENPINRYSISPRQDLKPNPDGSVDLYIQHASPGANKESNWLPAPTGKFILMLRLYWPNEGPPSILDGSWKPPAVEKESSPSVTAELG